MEYDPTDEDWSPARLLGAYTDVLATDYLQYWNNPNRENASDNPLPSPEVAGRMRELAEAATPSIRSLTIAPKVVDHVRVIAASIGITSEIDEEFAALLTSVLFSHPVTRDRIKIALAQHAVDDRLAGAEDRVPLLLSLVARRSLSERAAAFLDRATQLYLWGFEPESIVMCASILEAAYPSRFEDLVMFQLQIKKIDKRDGYAPYQYEHAALTLGVYSPTQKAAAERIREARNDILHNIPVSHLTPDAALLSTVGLLEALFPK